MYIQKLEFFVNPVKLYAFLNQGKRKDGLAFLHDATEKGFSIIAYGEKVFTEKLNECNPDNLREVFSGLSEELERQEEELMNYLGNFSLREEVERLPFLWGLLGFVSYDLGLGFESIQTTCTDDMNYPSYYFVAPEEVMIIDHEKKEMWVVLKDENGIEFYEGLRNVHFKEPIIMVDDEGEEVESNLTEEEYLGKIDRVREYLIKGETYQVNFSQRFNFQSLKSPWEIYKKVSEINPSSGQAFLVGYDQDGQKFSVVSNSPERLFRIQVEDGVRRIETQPIKGTIGIKGYESDEELAVIGQGLIDSVKDKAELEMIVDMSRNDLGRISKFGSVEVTAHRVLKKYSHLFHTVSTVSSRLRGHVKLYDIFRAVFPGASITGCPKKRTMEIIDELEQYARGVYCGSMGYLDCRGGADFNIMIRTLFARENHRAGHGYVMHSGGGVTIQSTPELEFKETFDKVNAFLHAIKED